MSDIADYDKKQIVAVIATNLLDLAENAKTMSAERPQFGELASVRRSQQARKSARVSEEVWAEVTESMKRRRRDAVLTYS